MEQVSSFFENILTIESGESPVATDNKAAIATDDSNTETVSIKDKDSTTGPSLNKKRMSDIDFSSFWSKPDETKKTSNSLMADKLMEKVISMIVPMNITTEQQGKILSERIDMQKTRPPLSIPIMSKNSIQLNQRLSPPFLLIDNIIHFFNWNNPFYTIGILSIITHIIANPYLLTVAPIALILFQILIPHYLIIYPPDSSVLNEYIENNPIPSEIPLDNYCIPKPVPEFTREFIMNLTDLQNHMLLYVMAYDFFFWLSSDYLYFKDEVLSSFILIVLVAASFVNLIILPKLFPVLLAVLPIKFILIISVWCVTILLHPQFRGKILDWIYSEETRLKFLNINNRIESYLNDMIDKENGLEPEPMQVEIFELQRFNKKYKSWNLIGFTNNIFSINSPYRNADMVINEETEEDEDEVRESIKINKKITIDEIKPPKNWEFIDKQWKLDLQVHAWVKRNIIEDMVYIDEDEKWVYDYQQEDQKRDVFRRRRWIRNCARENLTNKSTDAVEPTKSNSGEKVKLADYIM